MKINQTPRLESVMNLYTVIIGILNISFETSH